MKQKRNEKCKCGSGKKYKNCCYKTTIVKVGVQSIIPSYDIYRNDDDRYLDNLLDMNSKSFRKNWEKYGVTTLNNEKVFLKSYQTDQIGNEKLPLNIKYESKIFVKYGSRNKLFHLTSPLNSKNILRNGLKSYKKGDINKQTTLGGIGEIYLVESENFIVWNQLGFSQIGMSIDGLEIDVLEIDIKGINGNMYSENVPEYISPLHTVVVQDKIESRWIKKVGSFKTNRSLFYENRNEFGLLKKDFLLNQYGKYREVELGDKDFLKRFVYNDTKRGSITQCEIPDELLKECEMIGIEDDGLHYIKTYIKDKYLSEIL